MTKILKYKKIANNKYQIFLDNEEIITLYEETIIKNNLLIKKEIDEKQIKLLEEENNFYEYYYKALNYIKKRMHSSGEVKEHLNKMNCNLKDAEIIIKLLQQQKWLDDEKYLQSFLNDNINLNNNGPLKIKSELLRKGFDDSKIETLLITIDKDIWNTKINKIINKYTKNSKYQGFFLKQKVSMYLINLGYSKAMFETLVDDINIPINKELLKKDYQKILNKYQTKYDKFKLSQVIKQKLYQKGYPIEEINNIIK